MQGTTRLAARDLSVRLVGERQARVVGETRNDGVDRRVDAVDAIEVRRHHLAGGDMTRANEPYELARACYRGCVHPPILPARPLSDPRARRAAPAATLQRRW